MKTLKRVIFAITEGVSHKDELRNIRQNATRTRADIHLTRLKNQGIQTIIFDYDGILASHGKPEPDETGLALLKTAGTLFENIFILSNKPNETRQTYFATHFPNIDFIVAKQKKPYPDGINEILAKTNTPTKNMCLIDDRLTTGCLAAVLTGIQIIYILNPTTDYAYDFINECLFNIIRKTEQLLF
jgi:predicted HAD superfamily phosphohydrolase YqeG